MSGLYHSPGRQYVSAELIRHCFHYDPVTGFFHWKNPPHNRLKKGAIAGSVKQGRRIITVGGWHFLASNVAWLYVHNEWPEFELDHRNRDPLDDSINNLRDVTTTINRVNQGKRKTNTSGITGVYKYYNKRHKHIGWRARIGINRFLYSLGIYSTPELAAGAYRIAAACLHGDA